MTFVEAVELVARCLEGAGVAVIVIGALIATVLAIRKPVPARTHLRPVP